MPDILPYTSRKRISEQALWKCSKWSVRNYATIQKFLKSEKLGVTKRLHLTLYKWGGKIWTTDVKVPKSKYANLYRHTKISEIWKNRGNKTLTSYPIQVGREFLRSHRENVQRKVFGFVQAYENLWNFKN